MFFRIVFTTTFCLLAFKHTGRFTLAQYLLGANNSIDVNNDISFGHQVIDNVNKAIANKLSPSAQDQGANILRETMVGIKHCDEELQRNGILWQYKVCCSDILSSAMMSIGVLAQSSGAARLTLFW